MARRDRAVAVVGPGLTEDQSLLATARTVGARLAESGCIVVTGGLGGVMAAASEGASEVGGLVVGLLPGDAADANQWVDVAIATGLGEARNALVVRSARVVIAVGGSWGTLAEIALARRRDTPVIAIGSWQVVGPAADDAVITAADADGAVRLALELLNDVPA